MHHEGAHHLVAPEVRREVRQASHELLARAEQLDGAELPLDARIVARGGVGKGEKSAVEDFGARERREGPRVRRDTNAERQRSTISCIDGDGSAHHLHRCAAGIDRDLQTQPIPSR